MPPPLPEEKSEDAAALLGPVHIVQIRHPTFGGCIDKTTQVRRLLEGKRGDTAEEK